MPNTRPAKAPPGSGRAESKLLGITPVQCWRASALFPHAAELRPVRLQHHRRTLTNQLTPDLNRFGYEVQDVAANGSAVGACQQNGSEYARRIPNKEYRGDSAANAPHRTVPVDLPIAGIHHAEVALAIGNFSGPGHLS